MGWTYLHKPAQQPIAEFFRENWNHEDELVRVQVLDVAVVKLRTAYLAVRKTVKESGETTVFAVVALINYARNFEYNFGYKEMEESMEPFRYECPRRILEKLTDTDHPSALAWRSKCWDRIRRRAMLRKHPDWGILLPRPMVFGSDRQGQLFRKAKARRRRCLTDWSERGRYAVSLDRDYLVLAPSGADLVWRFLTRCGRIERRYWHHDPAHPMHRVLHLWVTSLVWKGLAEAVKVARLLQSNEDGLPAMVEAYHAASGASSLYTVDADGRLLPCKDDRPLVMSSVYGSRDDRVPEGYVGVAARVGGRFGEGDTRFFLVPDAEYWAWESEQDRKCFIVDPDRHAEIPEPGPLPASKEPAVAVQTA